MPKIKQCGQAAPVLRARCRFYRKSPDVCGIYPDGLNTDTDIDYRLNPFEVDF